MVAPQISKNPTIKAVTFLIFLSLVAFPEGSNAQTHLHRETVVTGVALITDADTIVVEDQVIRIYGIDAPETAQRCDTADDDTWDCSGEAVRLLRPALSDAVSCSGTEYDSRQRLIATCHTVDGVELGELLVGAGLAWAYVEFSSRYVALEARARREGLGIWIAETDPPWEFRRQRWEVEEQVAPEGCPIKGNISPNGRIYHTPWSRDYNRTRVSLENGERWFCDELEALEAGWRAPLTN